MWLYDEDDEQSTSQLLTPLLFLPCRVLVAVVLIFICVGALSIDRFLSALPLRGRAVHGKLFAHA
jgi:hypothetical protein